jgi:aldehyde dehydrogenase (NAD+)
MLSIPRRQFALRVIGPNGKKHKL